MKVGRKIFLFILCSAIVFFANAQKMKTLLQRANNLYESLEYSGAIKLYELYNKRDSTDQQVIFNLAKSYWNIRQYDRAEHWYNRILVDSILILESTIQRKAELSAMRGDNANAAKILNGLKKYKTRAQGFIQKNHFLKDSADWTIQYLNINTQKYREFSPLLHWLS